MLNFEERTGPRVTPPVEYPDLTVPSWWRDAKLGLFVHWGLYSLPAWATLDAARAQPEDAYAEHGYAEWYANTVRIAGSGAWRHHRETFGEGTTYEDLADQWQPTAFDADTFVGILAEAGARYIVPTTKHHDGFCLWGTATTPFNALRRGPKRDLIADIAGSVKARNIRFGVYFSGALDWHVTDLPPIRSDRDLFALRRSDASFARYAAAQFDELVGRFAPDILWNDIEWPDEGKGHQEYGVAALLGRARRANPEMVVNDRWGVPAHGHLTREYSFVPDILTEPWEATRGLGASFGYNQLEGPEQLLSVDEAVRLLIDVVSKNGNLLLNVGPTADGTIAPGQLQTLQGLGTWLSAHASAIYGTRPWRRFGDGDRLRFTMTGDTLFLHLLEPASGSHAWPADVPGGGATWLDGDQVDIADGRLVVPERLRGLPAAVVQVRLAS